MKLSQTAAVGVAIAVALAATLAMLPATKSARVASAPDNGTTIAVRQDRDAVTKTIRTIPISPLQQPVVLAPLTLPQPQPAAPVLPPYEAAAPAAAPPRARAARGAGDICQRHGGHREEHNHGRSWHCVFPGKPR